MKKSNVLVLGSGGREHAIVWSIYNDPNVNKVFCAPGNAGTSQLAENVNIDIMNNNKLLKFVIENNIDVTFVGPEQPLENGVVDFFESNKQPIFGPNKFSSQLETSKLFARYIMEKYNIPQPEFFECSTEEEILSIASQLGFPLVLKADGLAAGKGVIICSTKEELDAGIDTMITDKKFGKATDKISVEEFLYGEEVSVFAICDGSEYRIINSAQDHKRAFNDDKGPNTGGMGAYSPAPIFDNKLKNKVNEKILKPILKAMEIEDSPYKGFLYLGLMIADEEPYVIEFNVRLGDPETQVLLPLFSSSVFDVMMASINGTIKSVNIKMSNDYAVTVVLAAKGYPEKYNKGMEIKGLNYLNDEIVFHAGTKLKNNKIVSSGGRVLNVVGIDECLEEAISKAYYLCKQIDFKEKYFRTDIGQKAFKYYKVKEQ